MALPSPPPEMRLGAVVVGRAETEGQEVTSVPSERAAAIGRWAAGLGGRQGRHGASPGGRARSSSDADSVVVSRGLSAGEKVVTAGVNSLAEGQPVKPETEVK